jgi:hypothetical protein
MSKRLGLILCVAVVALVLALLCWSGPALTATTPSPSPSCSPTASPTAEPRASAELVRWALKWRAHAVGWRAEAAWARTCLGQRTPALKARPARSAPKAAWQAAGRAWKHGRARWERLERRAVHRLRCPGGYGAARWWPAARYAGWPAGTRSTLLYGIWRESRGNPRAVNPSSRCAGLLQIHPCHHVANVLDPLCNLRAGLRLYRASGWAPWSVM